MTVRLATVGGLDLAYETFGSPDDPTLILVMGLATQMLGWPEDFCQQLAAEGLHVVRFDNRDIGLSTHLDNAGVPDLSPLFSGRAVTESAYTLADMADDVAGLMTAIGVDRAHLVGASMGGMIAQEVALRHPGRLLSLTSVMSTTAPHVGPPTPEAMAALFLPPPTSVEEAGQRAIEVYRIIGSPGFPLDERRLASQAEESFRRAHDPAGVARQLAAIQVSGDRTERLTHLGTPTLVIHGEDDPLVRLAGGIATAESVPGARLVTYPGMAMTCPATSGRRSCARSSRMPVRWDDVTGASLRRP